MNFWEDIIREKLTFEEANKLIKASVHYYTTRPCWSGVHFYSKQGQYCILLRDGSVMIDAFDRAWSKDANDWLIVTLSDKAVNILEANNLI